MRCYRFYDCITRMSVHTNIHQSHQMTGYPSWPRTQLKRKRKTWKRSLPFILRRLRRPGVLPASPTRHPRSACDRQAPLSWFLPRADSSLFPQSLPRPLLPRRPHVLLPRPPSREASSFDLYIRQCPRPPPPMHCRPPPPAPASAVFFSGRAKKASGCRHCPVRLPQADPRPAA